MSDREAFEKRYQDTFKRPAIESGYATYLTWQAWQAAQDQAGERKHMEIKETELKRMMLLDRLKAAHDAQKELPKLLQELRDALGDELINQLCAAPNSGFGVNVWQSASKVDFSAVEHVDMTKSCCGNPEQCWEPCGHLGKNEKYVAVAAEPTEDMSDWRNWREGDEVTVFIGASKLLRTIIRILPDDDKQPIEVKNFSGNTSFPYWYQIKWHSRPAKGEK